MKMLNPKFTQNFKLLNLGFWVCLGFSASNLGFSQDTGVDKNNANLRLYPFKDELAKAKDYAKEKNWHKAVEILTSAVKAYPDHVVQSQKDKNLYLGIEKYVLQTIANFPEDGKKVYREQIDAIVKKRLEEARITKDIWTLQTLVAKYSLSTLMSEVLEVLGELYLENGEFAHAGEYLANVKTPQAYAKLAICFAREGDIGGYSKLVRDVQRDFPNAQIVIADKGERLLDFVNSLSVTPKALATEQKSPDIDISNPVTYPVPQVPYKDMEAESYGYVMQGNIIQPNYDVNTFKPIFPLVADNTVFWHNEYTTTAVDMASSKPQLLWEQKIQRQSQVVFDDRVTHTIAYDKGKVFTNMVVKSGVPERDQVYRAIVKVPFPKRALFAINAKTGKLIWKVDSIAELGDISFCQAPACEGDNLFVGVTVQKVTTDPFQHYVVCLDADTGKLKWATFIASGLTEINLFNNSTRDSIGSPVAIAGNMLFYSTNVGVVATLDKSSGGINWIYKYNQIPTQSTRNINFTRNPLEWINNAPVATDKLVFFTPTDSIELYALDRWTGEFRWPIIRERLPNNRKLVDPQYDFKYIYGIVGNNLYIGGTNLLYIYDISQEGKRVRQFVPTRGASSGKGAILGGVIYFPTVSGFYRLKSDTLEETDFTSWSIGGGNITTSDNCLVASSKDSVTIWREKIELPKLEPLKIQPQQPDTAQNPQPQNPLPQQPNAKK